MQYGLRKGLEDIAKELKGINNALSSLWSIQYQKGEIDVLDPRAYADEYITTEECATRLGVSDQTIRNWIALGRKTPSRGWVEGIHYVNICPDEHKKTVFRIPWTRLVESFAKNRKAVHDDFYKSCSEGRTTQRGEPI